MRKLLTLTGIDASTDISWLARMGEKYANENGMPLVEFGILRSPKSGLSQRYPDRKTISDFQQFVKSSQLAFHLCGQYARDVHAETWRELSAIIDFNSVSRVQVNSTECSAEAIIRLQRFSVFLDKPVIMQWREETIPCIPHLSLLQDRSGGRGVEETSWARASNECVRSPVSPIGYAGGLNPDNVDDALPKINKAARSKSFWIDCESGIRTDDIFDPEKAEAMMDSVFKFYGRSVRKIKK